MDVAAPHIGLRTTGISHLVVEVADAGRARSFYADRLGLAAAPAEHWPEAGEVAFRCPSGQHLVLAEATAPRTFQGSGVHQAYRAAPGAIARIVQGLASDGVDVHRYREDRPAEEGDNLYFADPDGNRVQLVAAEAAAAPGIAGIDHAAVQASDLEWEEEFYVGRLGIGVDHRVGWSTADYVRARAWGEGKEDMAPGTRRWDQRYRDIPGGKPGQGRRVPRPNMQIFLGMGDAVLGLYLATSHVQEPPLERAKGTPRVAFAVDRAELDRMAARLAGTGAAMLGPVEHPARSPLAASLYFRDPCGNFLELCTPRQGASAA